MEKRISKRITAGYRTEILYGGKSFTGLIENLSASGANVLTDPIDQDMNFQAEEPIDLKFEAPTGEMVVLKCTVMWSSKIPPHNVRHRIGMELIGRPWDKIAYFL